MIGRLGLAYRAESRILAGWMRLCLTSQREIARPATVRDYDYNNGVMVELSKDARE